MVFRKSRVGIAQKPRNEAQRSADRDLVVRLDTDLSSPMHQGSGSTAALSICPNRQVYQILIDAAAVVTVRGTMFRHVIHAWQN